MIMKSNMYLTIANTAIESGKVTRFAKCVYAIINMRWRIVVTHCHSIQTSQNSSCGSWRCVAPAWYGGDARGLALGTKSLRCFVGVT